MKYEHNPVLGGGDLGTVFDVSILKDDGVYKMYNSWRPKGSLALSGNNHIRLPSLPRYLLSRTRVYKAVFPPFGLRKACFFAIFLQKTFGD
ncbi:MAG: hypothetical protein LBL07_13960 [Tannerella sp.]|nr:hypothetical protein [Tannerella sp.]